LWYRGYVKQPEHVICRSLQNALDAIGAKRMIVGHTTQDGKILRRCHGRLYVIDVGITKVYGGHCGAIEIVGDTVTGLYCEGGDDDDWQHVRQVRKDIT
jgi:hypothetical protein